MPWRAGPRWVGAEPRGAGPASGAGPEELAEPEEWAELEEEPEAVASLLRGSELCGRGLVGWAGLPGMRWGFFPRKLLQVC